jgi:hypothetical protein
MDDDTNFDIVELVKLLQEINESPNEAKEKEFVIYDKDGNKIIL